MAERDTRNETPKRDTEEEIVGQPMTDDDDDFDDDDDEADGIEDIDAEEGE
jgi:hypothetical protein